MRVVRSSTLNRIVPGATSGPPAPVLWPRWVPTGPGRGILRMLPIPAAQIPPGWQSVRIRVPMKIAGCLEAECDFLEHGWTEVVTGETSHPYAGRLEPEEAGQIFGFGGTDQVRIPPAVIVHPAGTPCPRVHKIPAGLPPVYLINGRTVLWNEFEDAILGGWQRASSMS